jgi:murein DD-endopeptidase MepM/ murein hydrolase activator NlpD
MNFKKPQALSFIGLSLVLALITTSCANLTRARYRHVNASSGDIESSLTISQFKTPDPDQYKNEYIFDWPVDRARLSRGFSTKGRRPHMGIDLAAPRKTPVYAAHQGMVIYAGRDFRGFGNMILIESGLGWATLYAHLEKILVSESQKVKMGEPIGLMGSTGHSTGPHLHFEIRKNKGPVDPLLYLPGGGEASRKLASTHK